MTSKRLSLVLGAAVGLVSLLIIGGAYEVNAQLEQRSHKLVALQKQVNTLEDKKTQVAQDKRDLAKYNDLNTIAKSVVPQDKNLDVVLLQLVKIAHDSGVGTLSNVSFPNSTLGGTSSGTSNATTSNPNSSANSLTQLTKVAGISGVYDLPITISQNTAVKYDTFLAFLSALQQNQRTATISSISVTPNSDDSTKVTFSLTIDEYIKP